MKKNRNMPVVKLPMGIENFERIRKDGFYYVDKTRMIRDLLENIALVNLFTRPRRFGKTLNMSMLKYFFENTQIFYIFALCRYEIGETATIGGLKAALKRK